LFGILNFGHWDLFGIWDLLFEIYYLLLPETPGPDLTLDESGK